MGTSTFFKHRGLLGGVVVEIVHRQLYEHVGLGVPLHLLLTLLAVLLALVILVTVCVMVRRPHEEVDDVDVGLVPPEVLDLWRGKV
jgi:hypothetical protein